ncbi:MAG: sensor domain-containing phosphodiesterase [Prochlorococcaceae cyanobacterium]|jgi:EAL domain-containing protein (putative c-di-GMP-specific phosphodiesterase class I)
MKTAPPSGPDGEAIEALLRHRSLNVEFQPILSLRQLAIVGLEALARPKTMPLLRMFLAAQSCGRMLEVDRLCRQRALETFRSMQLPATVQRPLLFLNFEASVIDAGVVGSGWLRSSVGEAGLSAEDVVIEVNESQVLDLDSLRRFVDEYREEGFLIALDDLGAGDSNLPRIAQIRPHIIKLDRHLVAGVERDFFKQETIKSLVNLSRGIGAMVLAEGVETQGEVDTCAALGAELLQGFYFARPSPAERLDLDGLMGPLGEAASRQRLQATERLRARRNQSLELQHLAEEGCRRLQAVPPNDFDSALRSLLDAHASIEATYLLDSQGIQVSATHMPTDLKVQRSRLFEPAERGSNHSFKEYFYSLMDTGLTRFTTENYISLATGNPCRTVAVVLEHARAPQPFVLCLDFRLSGENAVLPS